MLRNLFFALSFLIPFTAIATPTLSRDALLHGCEIPEHRDYRLSTTVSACEDFHKFACGEIEGGFQLPQNRTRWTFSITDNYERLLYAKKAYFRLLNEGYQPKSPRARQLRDYYLGCMDPAAANAQEIELVKKEKNILDAVKSKQDLTRLITSRFNHPDFSFIDWGDNPSQDDPNLNDVIITASDMTLPEKSYYEDQEAVNDLDNLALAFFKAVGTDRPKERAHSVVEFEKAFAKFAPTPEEMRKRSVERNYRSREDFLKLYPNLGLEKLFALLPTQVKARDFTPEVLTFLSKNLETESLETLKNVVFFHDLMKKIDDSNPEYRAVLTAFVHKHLGGPAQRPERDERCTTQVMKSFGMELDEELIPVLFPGFPSERVEKTAERVRSSILQGLKENTWLTESTRAEAMKKIQIAKLMLVKPTREEDWGFLPVKKYNPKKPLTNAKLVQQAEIDRMIKEIGERRNRNRWHMSPLTINAYYSPPDNTFVLPLGILQFPFFDEKLSDLENLAAIGMVVGHELGHGIDDQGSNFDAEGKLRNWKTERDQKEFNARAQKFVELYNSLGHNGELTLGENIGDHEGLTFAFNAAFSNPKAATDEQVRKFYISYARLWCTVATPEADKVQLKTNPHSLGWARINGQVIQSDAFQNAFGCKAGDKMFVEKSDRIRLW